MKDKPTLAVVGGGASGLIAGISAKRFLENRGNVVIIERMDRIGKKILATGNGRCNFTNMNTSVSKFYGKNPEFAKYALDKFGVYDVLDFFGEIGIYSKEEEDGKVYPYSDRSSSILEVLRNEIQRLGVKVVTGFEVKSVKKVKSFFKIVSFLGEALYSDAVIVAAGGRASPNLGSNGTGFEILSSFGHNISKVVPALVQLKTHKEDIKGLKGIKFTGGVKIALGSDILGEEFGEVLFTDYGLSGPPIFQLSVISALHKDCSIILDFMPELSEKEVFDLLLKRKELLSHLNMESFFIGLLNKRIGNVIARKAGIEKLSFLIIDLDKKTLWKIAKFIKSMRLDIIGHNGWNNAQVTAGGVETDGFNSETMESNLVRGLYAVGEVLDIFGGCGGFNLQWAWSSGALAGKSAAKRLLLKE